MLQESTRDLGLQVAATVRVLGECLRACLRIYKGACFHRTSRYVHLHSAR